MKIVAFGASSSRNSINKKLVIHALDLFSASLKNKEDLEIDVLDLNDYEMPIYSIDRENTDGIPELAKLFFAKIASADGLIISYAEHNGFYTSAFKNIFDWVSRVEKKVFQDKPMVVMSASSGKNGGANVLKFALESAPFYGADILSSFPVGPFSTVFDLESSTLVDKELSGKLIDAMEKLHEAIK